MNLTQAIRLAILERYSDGQLFISHDFEYLRYEGRITSSLSIMCKKGFIEKVGTIKSDRKVPPLNTYKLAGTTHQIAKIKTEILLSQWHSYPDIPERNGIYEVMYYDGKKSKIEWNGKWHLPIPYIKGWRGIAK